MEPIHALVFSKDRAMQLDAFLRSAERYAPYASVTVLYSEPPFGPGEHGEGYGRVALEHNSGSVATAKKAWIKWHGEVPDFETATRNWIEQHERVVFHTDDELFFAEPPADLLELDNSECILTLRQGRNTTWCHPLNCPQLVPESFPWRWRDEQLDFAYPLSLNACVYNSKDILPLIDFHFTNPTQLEAQLAANAARLTVDWMTAPAHSCTVAVPHNVTSVSSGNPRGAWPDYQPEALRRFYLDGWRIDPFAMDYTKVNAAHVELPLVFTHPDFESA